MKRILLALWLTAGAVQAEEGWVSLFDGQTLTGWKANESPETWAVVDGAIVAKGPVSHLYYMGREFGDFELKAEVRTAKNTNSGIFFRTPWKDSGWLPVGYEAQIQNSGQNKCYTGGLWIHADRAEPSPVKDGEWFEVHIIAVGDKIVVKINGQTTTEYDAAADPRKGLKKPARGFIVLQGHGPQHRPEFRNIRIKTLEGR
jgi:hypothetical protein